jgi:hypothetical protein
MRQQCAAATHAIEETEMNAKYSYLIVSNGKVVTIVNRREVARSKAYGYSDAVIYRSQRLHTHSGHLADRLDFTLACEAAIREYHRVADARLRDVILAH